MPGRSKARRLGAADAGELERLVGRCGSLVSWGVVVQSTVEGFQACGSTGISGVKRVTSILQK